MKIEIWSDVACPFCYIGKRHLEKAIEQLLFKDDLDVVWKSYQLDPNYYNTNNESIYQHLANSKGMSVEQAKQMTAQVVQMAKDVQLDFNFDKNIPANTFDAHRLIHFAALHNLQDAAKEALLCAYFIGGLNVADRNQLAEIGAGIGLKKEDILSMLQSDRFTDEVNYDIRESKEIGIQGVPFFVFDSKYAVSGAQPISAFVEILNQSYKAAETIKPIIKPIQTISEGSAACDDDGCVI